MKALIVHDGNSSRFTNSAAPHIAVPTLQLLILPAPLVYPLAFPLSFNSRYFRHSVLNTRTIYFRSLARHMFYDQHVKLQFSINSTGMQYSEGARRAQSPQQAGYDLDDQGSNCRQGQNTFFWKTSRPALGPPQAPIGTGDSFCGSKVARACSWPPSSAEVKN